MNPAAPTARRRPYLLYLLVFLIAAPTLLSWWLQSHPEWLPTGQSQHGRLLHPPRKLADASLYYSADQVEARLYGKWTLLQLQDGACKAKCLERLQLVRFTRLISARYSHRTQQLLLLDDTTAAAPPDLTTHPGLLLYQDPEAARQARRTLTPKKDSEEKDSGEQDSGKRDSGAEEVLYLVDPAGRVILAYTAEDPAGALIEDLKRLLRYNRGQE